MQKAKLLEELKQKIVKDTYLPLRENATQLVFGEGNPDAKAYFLGEAPGETEDKTGRPFVGRAGKLLEQILGEISLNREDVYISNTVRFRPPKNRQPTPSEIAAFLPYVNEEINIIKPKVVVTLGRFAMEKFLSKDKITKVHGKPRNIIWNNKKLILLPMFHPSAALRSPDVKKLFIEDFKNNSKLLNDPS